MKFISFEKLLSKIFKTVNKTTLLLFVFSFLSNCIYSQASVHGHQVNAIGNVPDRSPTILNPGGMQVNDMALFSVWWRGGTTTINLPVGYTLVDLSSSTNITLATFYKILTSSDTALSSFTFSNLLNSNRHWTIAHTHISGFDIGSPIQGVVNNVQNTSTPSALPLLTTRMQTLVLNLFTINSDYSFTSPSGTTPIVNIAHGNGNPRIRAGLLTYFVQPNLDSTGTRTASISSSVETVSQTIAINNVPTMLPSVFSSINIETLPNKNILKWAVFQGMLGSQFEILKSKDKVNWQKVGVVDYEDSIKLGSYLFLDRNMHSSLSYYKINMVQENEIYTQSEVYSILNTYPLEKIPSVFPNPFSNFINIESEDNVGLEIFDIHGRKVQCELLSGVVDLSSLELGVYTLQISNLKTGQKWTQKIIKNE